MVLEARYTIDDVPVSQICTAHSGNHQLLLEVVDRAAYFVGLQPNHLWYELSYAHALCFIGGGGWGWYFCLIGGFYY